MCAGEVHPASLLLAKVSCARNGTYATVRTLLTLTAEDGELRLGAFAWWRLPANETCNDDF
jgi:hypothetical protein